MTVIFSSKYFKTFLRAWNGKGKIYSRPQPAPARADTLLLIFIGLFSPLSVSRRAVQAVEFLFFDKFLLVKNQRHRLVKSEVNVRSMDSKPEACQHSSCRGETASRHTVAKILPSSSQVRQKCQTPAWDFSKNHCPWRE